MWSAVRMEWSPCNSICYVVPQEPDNDEVCSIERVEAIQCAQSMIYIHGCLEELDSEWHGRGDYSIGNLFSICKMYDIRFQTGTIIATNMRQLGNILKATLMKDGRRFFSDAFESEHIELITALDALQHVMKCERDAPNLEVNQQISEPHLQTAKKFLVASWFGKSLKQWVCEACFCMFEYICFILLNICWC